MLATACRETQVALPLDFAPSPSTYPRLGAFEIVARWRHDPPPTIHRHFFDPAPSHSNCVDFLTLSPLRHGGRKFESALYSKIAVGKFPNLHKGTCSLPLPLRRDA
jgi:hypothetical protein